MITEAEFSHLLHGFPILSTLDPERRQWLRQRGQVLALDGVTQVFDAGDRCEQLLLLTDGSVKVVAAPAGVREILLYRVEPGELCVISLSCALGHRVYPARGSTEGPARAVAIATSDFEELIEISPELRRLVFGALSERVHELMGLVEEVAFRKLDQRLALALARAFERAGGTSIQLTHQELADEVGSARELVSRVLAQLEGEGLIELGRRRIDLRNPDGLRARSDDL